VTIDDTDGESGGLNAVVRSWLKDNGGGGFVGLGGLPVEKGVNGMLRDAVGRVGVDGAVFDVLMILLYVESPWERVRR
jgi:hypothetical protein